MWYIRPQSDKNNLTIKMKGYILVPLNWIGKIEYITMTSTLLTDNMPTVQDYQNIYSRQKMK